MSVIEDFNSRCPITALVDERISEDNKARAAEHEPGKLYPSSVHKCSRALCYELLGYPREEMQPRILKIMDNGNYVHERYQKLWKEMGILIADEVPIKEESLKISGRMDALLCVESHIAIGELKSSGDSPFSKMKKSNKPDDKFVAQVQLYMHLANVDLACIYVENKNTQDVLEFWVDYDPVYCEQLFAKLKYVRDTVNDKQIITRDCAAKMDLFMVDKDKMYKDQYTQYAFYCRYCDYNKPCYSKKEGEK